MFKMDLHGHGILIETTKMTQILDLNTHQFMYLCLLKGTDYNKGLPGVGLKRGYKAIKQAGLSTVRTNCIYSNHNSKDNID